MSIQYTHKLYCKCYLNPRHSRVRNQIHWTPCPDVILGPHVIFYMHALQIQDNVYVLLARFCILCARRIRHYVYTHTKNTNCYHLHVGRYCQPLSIFGCRRVLNSMTMGDQEHQFPRLFLCMDKFECRPCAWAMSLITLISFI
jgi:hypothetical protein